jgi:hypothetical protein
MTYIVWMADVRILIGRKYEVMQDERRQATNDFAAWLRSRGLSVDLEIIEYEPKRRGLTPIEWTEFFIGTSVASSLIGNITTDLYNGAKRLLRRRREAKRKETGSPGRHLGFRIRGPDDKLIAEWTTKEDEDAHDAAKKSQEKSAEE